jgi:NAD+ kinase
MGELVGFVYNAHIPRAATLVESLVKSLGLEGRSWACPVPDIAALSARFPDTSVVITAGGDGTILRTVHVAALFKVPILGVNLGRVGFMTELGVEEAAEKIPSYLDGSHRVEERMMIEATVHRSDGGASSTAHSLNDVVVARGPTPHLLDIYATIDGVPLTTYRADGLVICTPTGSTGYALSAGGPIVHPEAREILLQPVAAHMSLNTGLVVPGTSIVDLAVREPDGAVFSVDGVIGATLEPGDRVTVRSSPHTAMFLRAGQPADFYTTLTRWLRFGGRPAPT